MEHFTNRVFYGTFALHHVILTNIYIYTHIYIYAHLVHAVEEGVVELLVHLLQLLRVVFRKQVGGSLRPQWPEGR